MKLIIELDESQLSRMTEALEMYTRLMMGQFDVLDLPYYDRTAANGQYENFKTKLDDLHRIAFPELGLHAIYGIGNKKTPEGAKITYELYKAIRWKLYCAAPYGGPYDGPTPPTEVSGHPLPEVAITDAELAGEKRMTLTIELDMRQISYLNNALELYSRLMAGQFAMLAWPYMGRISTTEGYHEFSEKLAELKAVAFPELLPNEDYGIYQDETPMASKITYELYKAIRYEMWRLAPYAEHSVDSTPAPEISGHTLPKVTIEGLGV